jgi:exodeoxyribonuclease VII small subunit
MSEASRDQKNAKVEQGEGAEATGRPPSFEQAIEQLETIIEGIESGEVGLESSLEQYERGMKLIRHCRGVLERAEHRIEKLTVDESGELASPEDGEAGESADEQATGPSE